MALTEGWIIFDSGGGQEMKIHGKWKLKQKNPDVWIEHYSGGNFGFDIGSRLRTVSLKDLYFETQTDAETFLEYIDLLNDTLGGFKLELQTHSDNSKFKLNGGTSTTMMVLILDYSDVEKVPHGDTQLYKIASVRLEQAT
ncbi:hypothetical protein LCGC14_1114850 [marine sediment metagenome]|uniref:Uncharacterized protein n=1 Tax=marine sediment metagenome TaxID=412755 RepID=A0A0F9MTL7_9ZZZZ